VPLAHFRRVLAQMIAQEVMPTPVAA
jgi:hypothetical protein